MKKKLGIALAVLVVLFIVVVVGVLVFINSIARKGIEFGATHTLGVNTTVGGVNIGLFSGQAGIKELSVANPGGFKSPHFLQLGKGEVALSLGSLTKDVIQVPKFELSGIDVYLEKKDGKANYQVILDNLQGAESKQKEPQTTSSGKPAKKLIIGDLLISNVTVHADVLPVGAPLTLKVPEIHMQNLGSDGSGVTVEEVTDIVVKSILASAMNAGQGILPDDVTKSLGDGLQGLSSLTSQGVEVVGDLGKSIGDLGQSASQAVDQAKQVGQKAGEVGKEAGQAVKDLGNTFGNMFGGKKDENKDK